MWYHGMTVYMVRMYHEVSWDDCVYGAGVAWDECTWRGCIMG